MTKLKHIETGEILEMPELIELQGANVKVTPNHGGLTWRVRKNITGETLQVFKANITEQFMFQILGFARKYELKAFNTGIKFQKNNQNKLLVSQANDLKATISKLAQENERLANILDKMTNEA